MAMLGPAASGHAFYVIPGANADAPIDASVTATDGADVLAANVSPLVAVSSAIADGADVLAGNVAPVVAVSSATTDGADTLAGQVAPIVAVSSATTDRADALAGSLAPLVDVSSSTTDGGDVLAAAVAPEVPIDAAVDSTEGADTLDAAVECIDVPVPVSGPGWNAYVREAQKKKRRQLAIPEDEELARPKQPESIQADAPEPRELLSAEKFAELMTHGLRRPMSQVNDEDEEEAELLLLTI